MFPGSFTFRKDAWLGNNFSWFVHLWKHNRKFSKRSYLKTISWALKNDSKWIKIRMRLLDNRHLRHQGAVSYGWPLHPRLWHVNMLIARTFHIFHIFKLQTLFNYITRLHWHVHRWKQRWSLLYKDNFNVSTRLDIISLYLSFCIPHFRIWHAFGRRNTRYSLLNLIIACSNLLLWAAYPFVRSSTLFLNEVIWARQWCVFAYIRCYRRSSKLSITHMPGIEYWSWVVLTIPAFW